MSNHYRTHRVRFTLTDDEIASGQLIRHVDPYKFVRVFDLGGGPREHLVKKCMRFTSKGHTERQVIEELQQILNRWKELLDDEGL